MTPSPITPIPQPYHLTHPSLVLVAVPLRLESSGGLNLLQEAAYGGLTSRLPAYGVSGFYFGPKLLFTNGLTGHLCLEVATGTMSTSRNGS